MQLQNYYDIEDTMRQTSEELWQLSRAFAHTGNASMCDALSNHASTLYQAAELLKSAVVEDVCTQTENAEAMSRSVFSAAIGL